MVYRIHYLGSGRNRIRIFFQNQYPAGTGFGSFFQIKILPEPDPDLFFKLISGRIRIKAKIGRIQPDPEPHLGSGRSLIFSLRWRQKSYLKMLHQLKNTIWAAKIEIKINSYYIWDRYNLVIDNNFLKGLSEQL